MTRKRINRWVGHWLLDIGPLLMMFASALVVVWWLVTGVERNPGLYVAYAVGIPYFAVLALTVIAWLIKDTIESIQASKK